MFGLLTEENVKEPDLTAGSRQSPLIVETEDKLKEKFGFLESNISDEFILNTSPTPLSNFNLPTKMKSNANKPIKI